MTILRFTSMPGRFAYNWLAVIYLLNAMGAYQVFSVPLQWLGSFLAVLSFILVLYKGGSFHKYYFYPLLLILVIIFISVAGWQYWSMYIDFADLLPPGATTDYYLFIFLRYLQYFVLFAEI